ncbi:MAG: DUF1836 domain-containing protein [Bacilli bacterium]
MSETLKDLNEYFKNLEKYKLPDYKELPQIPLYMEQVITYVKDALNPIYINNDQIITPFMVNNYVKAKIIGSPKDKKYSTDLIAYLISISLLKGVVPMKDIAVLIDMDKKFTDNKQSLYALFKSIQDEAIKNQAHKVKVRLDAIDKAVKKKPKKGESQKDIENLNLIYVALRLYTEADTAKSMADSIMSKVSKDVLPKSVLVESKKEIKYTTKKEHKEAKKIGSR